MCNYSSLIKCLEFFFAGLFSFDLSKLLANVILVGSYALGKFGGLLLTTGATVAAD